MCLSKSISPIPKNILRRVKAYKVFIRKEDGLTGVYYPYKFEPNIFNVDTKEVTIADWSYGRYRTGFSSLLSLESARCFRCDHSHNLGEIWEVRVKDIVAYGSQGISRDVIVSRQVKLIKKVEEKCV